MSYPMFPPGRHLFVLTAILLLTIEAKADPDQEYSSARLVCPHISLQSALYDLDTSLLRRHSGIVRHEKNGDVVITVPAGSAGHYKIRFFDQANSLLFEIRQINDPLLIVEKYNFRHAGQFQYELYRDNSLIEKSSFRINTN